MNKNPLQLIADNYMEMNKMMVKEIELATAHPGLTGNHREEMWKKFFRDIIPQKFSLVHGAMIIDSDKRISNEVDIAVIDEQYTPYIFRYHTLKLIPIEAVAMVIECKSRELSSDKLKGLKNWAESIEKLKANRTGIARFAQGYASGLVTSNQSLAKTKTYPIKVLVSLKESVKNITLDTLKQEMGDHFDFIIQEQPEAGSGDKVFQLLVKNEERTLGWWGDRLNQEREADNHNAVTNEEIPIPLFKNNCYPNDKELEYAKEYGLNLKKDNKELTNTLKQLRIEGNSLLTLNLQLNQLLMLINNPMLFPHFAYAKAFQGLQGNLN